MNNTLEELLKQQAELARKIADLQAQEKAEQERIAAEKELERQRNQKFNIVFLSFDYGYLTMRMDGYNDKVVGILRNLSTRRYQTDGKNVFHVRELKTFLDNIAQINIDGKIVISWEKNVQENADKWLNTPPYHISLRERDFLVVIGPIGDRYRVANLPGVKQEKENLSVPLTEGWRLIEALENLGPVYTPEALAFIHKQVELRSKLEEIAELKDVDYPVEFQSDFELRPFQRVGAYFAEAAGGNIILADQTGTGKTAQCIAYAWKNDFKRVIVVCPANLKKVWYKEIVRLTGERPYVLVGGAPSHSDILHILTEKPRFIIINYDILGKNAEIEKVSKDAEGFLHKKVETRWLWIELLNMYQVDLTIWDEAHYLQNHGSNRSQGSRILKSPRNVLATATPLMNNPSNMWPLLTIIDSELFPSHDHFVNRYTTDGKHAKNVQELREILKTKMIRRLKKDVIKDLPQLIPINDYQELNGKARKLYEKVLQGVYQVVKEWNPGEAGAEKKVTNILVQIMRLKQICAIAKIESTADKAVELFDNAEGNDNRKVIIFSQFVPIVKGIAKRLGHEAIVMTGEQTLVERNALVWQFQNNPDVHFAVCSSKAISEGLTMTQAGSMIFHDLLWTPAGHEQCIGRAYGRLNDAHGIDVYYEICEDTIEEWIKDLLVDKQNTIDIVVEGSQDGQDGSVMMDLIRKIKNSM